MLWPSYLELLEDAKVLAYGLIQMPIEINYKFFIFCVVYSKLKLGLNQSTGILLDEPNLISSSFKKNKAHLLIRLALTCVV